ncbi:MAG: phosphoserine phosphatase/homoserine phosphotransferase bifunctional protein [Proteobacteria bacterium HN_bin10]|nr:MAG: phosphoserine phosphatase/homoserine phosphotransferase bifunctional protein [Proteobacteria bacterium HN_bin10]
MHEPVIACLDMEGVLTPEIWINVAEKTGIAELRLTTRDIPDYDVLMKKRLGILDQHKLTLADIQEVIGTLKPLDGAVEFVNWLRERCQVIVLSDTFYEFAAPLMRQFGYPALFCNRLEMDETGRIRNYHLRQRNQKRQAVVALKSLYFKTVAIGDAYNDTPMLLEADLGIFFRPPDKIITEFPQIPVTRNYGEVKAQLQKTGWLAP